MTTKNKIKYMVDFSMIVLLILLMAYSLVGESAHEWLGVTMFVLFIVHHALNFNWLKNLPRGPYTGVRMLQTIVTVLVFLTMVGSMVSGIAMSRHVFGFVRFQTSWAQKLHLFSAYWGFLLMSLHLGLHGAMFLGIFRRLSHSTSSMWRTVFLRCIAGMIVILGIISFQKNQLTDYLFLRTHFVMLDFRMTLTIFLLNYLCIMGLFVLVGYYLGKTVQIVHRVLNSRFDKYER